MGYDVHITRKVRWFEEDGPEISLPDWLDYVASDPEMRADGYAEAETPSGVLRMEDEGIAVWTAYSGHGVGGNMAWFCHFGDRITVKNPDEAIMAKMHRIASSLGARVQGDEGEEYGPDGLPKGAAPRSSVDAGRPWWKFW